MYVSIKSKWKIKISVAWSMLGKNFNVQANPGNNATLDARSCDISRFLLILAVRFEFFKNVWYWCDAGEISNFSGPGVVRSRSFQKFSGSKKGESIENKGKN